MAVKKNTKSDVSGITFLVGCNLSDDRRFEKGDAVPDDITAEDLKALKDMSAIAEAE